MLRMFYFSGTGNARNVAQWMAFAWRGRHRDAEVVDLAKVDTRGIHVSGLREDTIRAIYARREAITRRFAELAEEKDPFGGYAIAYLKT